MISYDLYLTIDASGKGTVFDSLNLTLWADPKGNDGTPSVSETSDPSFSNGTKGDFALAHGTLCVGDIDARCNRNTSRPFRRDT